MEKPRYFLLPHKSIDQLCAIIYHADDDIEIICKEDGIAVRDQVGDYNAVDYNAVIEYLQLHNLI